MRRGTAAPPGRPAPNDDAQDFKDVTVTVKNGVLRLTGTVPTGTRRLEAAVLGRSIQGVRAIQEDLRVTAA